MNKKLIIFTSYDSLHNPYYGGGGAQAIHSVAKRLVKWYDVLIVTANYPGAKDYTEDGVRYSHIGIFLHPKLDQILFSTILPFKLITHRSIAIIESLTPPFSSTLLPLFARSPVIALVHMLSARDMQRKYRFPFLFFERLGLRLYRHFIVLSPYWLTAIKKYNQHAQFSVINNGVEQPLKHNFPRPAKPYLLFLGRIEIDQKGLDLLIEAYAKSGLTTPLLIAGTGDPSQINALKDLIRQANQAHSVRLIGKVTGQRKARLLSQAICCIIPSRYETFSMTALESLSYGTPVVCFNIPGLHWLSLAASLRITPFSRSGLTRAIRKIAQNDELRTRLSREATRIAARYNWDRLALKYRHAIEALQ